MSKTSVKIKILNIENDGIHLMIHGYVNGRKAVMILDTGASKTVFDKKRIEKFTKGEAITKNDKKSTGVGGNNIESHETRVKLFRLGQLTIKNYMTVLLDLSHVNESYKSIGLPAIDGVLGSDILHAHKALIDYHQHKLHLTVSNKTGRKR